MTAGDVLKCIQKSHQRFLNAIPFNPEIVRALGVKLLDLPAHYDNANSRRWLTALQQLPGISAPAIQCELPAVTIKAPPLSESAQTSLRAALDGLKPWRKGPFSICDIEVDAEWRSDMKWDRLAAALPDLRHQRVLDIGCNNGYYMFRMHAHQPKMVVGIDPSILYLFQFLALQQYVASERLFFLVLGFEDLAPVKAFFDVVLCLGILYHHRSPFDVIAACRNTVKPGGTVLIESMTIPGEEPVALTPQDRYAGMPNVYFIPTVRAMSDWLVRGGFTNIEVISTVPTTVSEQRATSWMGPVSLAEVLDPEDPTRTIEGLPAPMRTLIRAVRK